MGFAPSNLAVAREALRYLGLSRTDLHKRGLLPLLSGFTFAPIHPPTVMLRPASLGVAPDALGAAGHAPPLSP